MDDMAGYAEYLDIIETEILARHLARTAVHVNY